MKLSTSSVVLAALLASSVSAAPLSLRRSGIAARHQKGQGKGKGGAKMGQMRMMNMGKGQNQAAQGGAQAGAVGAAYFITNEPDGNFVFASSIGSDGTVTPVCAVATGGNGGHGVSDPLGPDPLFTQGAVKASAAANMLAAVNAGSNTLSLFSIDPTDPTKLTPVGQPQDTGGEFPVSVAFNAQGDTACVLNGGAVNGVQCYTVDAQTGLTAIDNTIRDLKVNQTTPPNGPAGTVSHVLFTEDGSQLVASIKGVPPTPGMLAVWDVAADGSLSEDFQAIAPPTGGLLPFSMSVIPGKNAILATDAGIGFEVYDFSGNGAAGAGAAADAGAGAAGAPVGVGAAIAIDGQVATCWSSFSKQTGNLYLTDIGTSQVSEVNVDDNLQGTFVKAYDLTAGTATIDNDIAAVNGNDFMYVLSANTTTINVMSLNAPGQAQMVQQLNVADAAQSGGVTVDPFNVQGMTTFITK